MCNPGGRKKGTGCCVTGIELCISPAGCVASGVGLAVDRTKLFPLYKSICSSISDTEVEWIIEQIRLTQKAALTSCMV